MKAFPNRLMHDWRWYQEDEFPVWVNYNYFTKSLTVEWDGTDPELGHLQDLTEEQLLRIVEDVTQL